MEIHFELENRCSLMCRHCSSNASAKGIEFDYSIEKMIDFLSAISEEKMVFFTGGEPLLNKDFENILMLIKKRVSNVSVGIFTSGIVSVDGNIQAVSDNQAKRLAKLGLKTCYFSVYSHDAKVHDWMTQTQRSFNLTKESIENLRNAEIEIRFNTVITKLNKDCIDKIIQLALFWNVEEVRLLKLIKHGRACFCWNEIGLSENEYRNTVKDILNKKHNMRITASSAIDIIACRPVENSVACQAGSKLLYVTFNGDIYPCASVKNNITFCIGNIKKKRTWAQYLVDEKTYRENPLCQGDYNR